MILLCIPTILALALVLPGYLRQERAWHAEQAATKREQRAHRYYQATGQLLPEYWTRTVGELPAVQLKARTYHESSSR